MIWPSLRSSGGSSPRPGKRTSRSSGETTASGSGADIPLARRQTTSDSAARSEQQRRVSHPRGAGRQTGGSRWSSAPDQLPETAGKGFPVKNLARRPQLCGDVLLISRTARALGLGTPSSQGRSPRPGRSAGRPVLTRADRPWTNVYGVARSMLALATLLTLLADSSERLFIPASGDRGPGHLRSKHRHGASLFFLAREHLGRRQAGGHRGAGAGPQSAGARD